MIEDFIEGAEVLGFGAVVVLLGTGAEKEISIVLIFNGLIEGPAKADAGEFDFISDLIDLTALAEAFFALAWLILELELSLLEDEEVITGAAVTVWFHVRRAIK